MRELTTEEKKRNKKLNEAFLYDLGYQHSQNICEETDQLLEEYKDLEFPKSLDKWFDDFSKEQKKKEKKKLFQQRSKLITKRVAIFIIVFFTVSASLTLGVEAFRIRFFNLFVVEKANYTDLSVLENNSNQIEITRPEGWGNYYFPSYLPSGFNLTNYKGVEGYRELHFNNGIDNISMYEQNGEIEFVSHVDTEGVTAENVTVNGNNGIYVFKGDKSTIAWLEGDTLLKITAPVDKEEILKIAISIKKIN